MSACAVGIYKVILYENWKGGTLLSISRMNFVSTCCANSMYSVLPKIIGQRSVLFGVEALAYLRGHWGVTADGYYRESRPRLVIGSTAH
jgi:hypothetical protein